MSEAPQETADVSRQSSFNGIVVLVLVVVGLLGTGLMLYARYEQSPSAGATAPPPQERAAAVAPAAVTPALPAGATQYALQLAPFSDVATAEDLRAKLDKLGIASTLSVEARVQLGPFGTQADVDAARAKLKEMGIYGSNPLTIK